ncbi:glycosyltransferase [Cellulophaga baltica]|uniref:glycosyltransferase n=1 Tax=Cellulophaga baltica TaxID=76594 RepID=UPI0015F42EAE|nr:glycosyltransferase [Cellulophaga baltica]MBA6314711.1 glycosyltransferase [Cellulophaga baltica]
MKKLLQINVVSNTGSTGRIAEDIGALILENNWESYIAYGRYGNPSKSKLIKVGNKLNMYLHILKSRLFDKHGYGSTTATKKLVKKIKLIKPDIIHLHNIHGYYIDIDILFKYLTSSKIPVVWTLHDCWAITGHCSHFEYIDCNKWIDGCFSCPQINAYPKSYIIDNSKNNYINKKHLFNTVRNLTIVPVSIWLQEIIKKSYLGKNSIQTIHNGIDLSVFNDANKKEQLIKTKYRLENKFIILGVASIWTKSKGFEDFCTFSKNLENDEVIVLVGLNKEQITQLPKKIIGIERTENINELAEIYSIANVYINLTYADTFPTTNLEALACGTPVITYNTGGSPEAINNETGFVIPKGDFQTLSQKIKIIKTNGKEFYKDNCIKRARINFDKKDRYKDYLDLYNNLLHKKH